MATRIGTYLDRYEIEAELGRGAMGKVYRAHDPKLDRTVAIKTISIAGLGPEAEREYRRRFVVEAQAAARLSHPGIVTIFDVREEDEPYLVMEYVEGQSLQQLASLETGRHLGTTLRLVQEIAEALHHAHAQGVVHRDIKPANILVTGDGHPKIADFGIAKLSQTDLTLPGQVLGSPAFMAPEQLSEEGADSRSDLFSLGVILYYLLTGHRPFQGNSTTTVCFKLVNQEPVPVSVLESKVPPELDAIVSRAMAKNPAQRYQTGMEMAADIRAVRERGGLVGGEDRPDHLNGGFIPRYISGTSAEAGSLKQESPERTAKSGKRTEKMMFTIAVFIFGISAVAVEGVALWHMQRSKPKQSESIDRRETDDKTRDDYTQVLGMKEEASVNPPVPISPGPIHRATSPVRARNTPAPAIPANAMLQIEFEHHFTNATASIWVDDVLAGIHTLQGAKQRRAIVLRKIVGDQFQVIRATPGRHQLRVQIESPSESYDQSRVITVVFTRTAYTLRVVCGNNGEGLQLNLLQAPRP